MKSKIETIIYGYDANEFIPVYYDGQLDKGSFIKYKAARAFVRFSDAFDRMRDSLD